MNLSGLLVTGITRIQGHIRFRFKECLCVNPLCANINGAELR
jgi:hypothetical protein